MLMAQRGRGLLRKTVEASSQARCLPLRRHLQAAINRFVAEHNQQPKPFTWTADPDKIIAAFSGHGSDEVEGEVADHRHVCGTVAAAQARLVLLELDIENPMQAVLDAPMGSGGLGEGLCGEDARGDLASPLDLDLGARLDTGLDHGDGAEALERGSSG